jgi:endoglucanase
VGGLNVAEVSVIAKLIRNNFNCVRLPFSLELVATDPRITNVSLVAANLFLLGRTALEAVDAVVQALVAEGLGVILDNHSSDAIWCCSFTDGNGLWYTDRFPTNAWMHFWGAFLSRFRNQPGIVGCDLRNELRSATVGGKFVAPHWNTWIPAASQLIQRLEAVRPSLLWFVEGLEFALTFVGFVPPVPAANVVYSVHSYSWDLPPMVPLAPFLNLNWGWLLSKYPIFLGETGTCHYDVCLNATWWTGMQAYIREHQLHFAVWAIDGTQSSGAGRTWGTQESFGVLNVFWNESASQLFVSQIDAL